MASMPAAKPPPVPVNSLLAAAALVILILGIVQATDLVQLPFVSWLCGPEGSVLSSGALSDFMNSYGYLSLFVLMTAESASVPIPSEIILPIAGFLTAQGVFGSLPIVLVVSTAAALAGALLDYYLARLLGRPFVLRIMRIFGLDTANLDRAEGWFERSGEWTVFAARFVPLVRALISFPAGLFRMGLGRFVLMTLAGCVVWNGILLYAGFAATNALDYACAGNTASFVVHGFALVVAVVAAVYLIYFVIGRRRHSGQ